MTDSEFNKPSESTTSDFNMTANQADYLERLGLTKPELLIDLDQKLIKLMENTKRDPKEMSLTQERVENLEDQVRQGKAVDETRIPKELKNKIKEMMLFAAEKSAEIPDMIGQQSGFYHVHLLTNEGVDRHLPQEEILHATCKNLKGILGHTQELEKFDVKKRSIFRGELANKCVIANYGKANGTTTPKDMNKINCGVIYFFYDKSNALRFFFRYTK